jgi:hypothetical protein
LQHDGTPARYGEYIRQWLKAAFPEVWTALGRQITYPAGSPDATQKDFFMEEGGMIMFTQSLPGNLNLSW